MFHLKKSVEVFGADKSLEKEKKLKTFVFAKRAIIPIRRQPYSLHSSQQIPNRLSKFPFVFLLNNLRTTHSEREREREREREVEK